MCSSFCLGGDFCDGGGVSSLSSLSLLSLLLLSLLSLLLIADADAARVCASVSINLYKYFFRSNPRM